MGIFSHLLWKNGQFWLVTIEFSIKEMPIYCFYRNAMHVQLPFVFLRVYWRILMAMKTLIFAKYPSSSKLPKNKIPLWNKSLQNNLPKSSKNNWTCHSLQKLENNSWNWRFSFPFCSILTNFPSFSTNWQESFVSVCHANV